MWGNVWFDFKNRFFNRTGRNFLIQFFYNFEPQATPSIVVQAFELLAAALESSFKRLNFDFPVNGGVTAASPSTRLRLFLRPRARHCCHEQHEQ